MSGRFPDIDWYCDRCNSYLNNQTVSHQTIFMNLKMILETKMIDLKGVFH